MMSSYGDTRQQAAGQGDIPLHVQLAALALLDGLCKPAVISALLGCIMPHVTQFVCSLHCDVNESLCMTTSERLETRSFTSWACCCQPGATSSQRCRAASRLTWIGLALEAELPLGERCDPWLTPFFSKSQSQLINAYSTQSTVICMIGDGLCSMDTL